MQAQSRRALPRTIKPGSGSTWVFMARGQIHSIRYNKGIIEIPQQRALFDKGSSPSSLSQWKERLLNEDSELLLRDQEAYDVALFKCSRVELEQRKGYSPRFLLHGYFQPKSPDIKLSVGYEAGIYKQEPGYLAPRTRYPRTEAGAASNRTNSNETGPDPSLGAFQSFTDSIRHYKDQKEMLLVKGDVVIYGQDLDASLDNFNPYFRDRNPKHVVRLSSFYMDKYEVTNAEYLYFCQRSGYPLPSAWQKEGGYARGRGKHPFHLASYRDAKAYARWANKRLPTELEWEMAARGGLSRWMNGKANSLYNSPPIYPIGPRFNAQFCNTLEAHKKDTLPVHKLRDKSPYGIIGLCGNAREWTSSWYRPYRGHYWSDKTKAGKVFKVIRGGSFAESRKAARADYRDYGGLPSLDADHSAGFRLVMSAEL